VYVEFLPYKLKHKLHLLKNDGLPEDGQQLRPQNVRALINK